MTKKETRLTNVLRSRGIAFILAVISVWMVWRCVPALSLPEWMPGLFPELLCVVNLSILIAVAAVMVIVNRTFSILRTISVFFAAYFLFITATTPGVAAGGLTSSLLALAVIFGMAILYSLYHVRASDRRIFLIFCILAAGGLFEWKFLFYIPIFFAGMVQMRILRFKKVIAALIGIVTPAWIAYGLDLLPIPSIPHIFFTPPSMILHAPGGWPFITTVAVTMVSGFLLGTTTLFRMLGFNARMRAYNGFLTILGAWTGLLAIVNFTNLADYVVLLNACVAFQVGHFFRATASKRGYIVILTLLAIYTGLYIWTVTTL